MSPSAKVSVLLLGLLLFFPQANAADAAVPVIDVLVIYAAPQNQWNAFQTEQMIAREIAEANGILLNSHARARFRLVHAAKVFYAVSATDEDSILLTRDRLIARGDGHLDEVHALRDLYNADEVLFWAPITRAGLASPALNADEAFGIVTGWDGYGFTKVLGRILGCGPETGAYVPPWEGPGGGIFPDSTAYELRGPDFYGTVMSSLGGSGMFSNPRISFFWRAAG
jgi:hypothetical protein